MDLRSDRRVDGSSRRRLVAAALAAVLAAPPVVPAEKPDQGAAGVETGFGLHTATFTTPHGVVRVNLPDDLTAGDTISGTVFEEPTGASETERSQNEDELSGYVVELEKQPSPVEKEQPQWTVPASVAAAAAVPLLLRDKQGREVARVSVPLQKPPAAEGVPAKAAPPDKAPQGELSATPALPSQGFELPSVGQAGKPVEVRGPFDGRAAETAVTFGGTAARVLAESPRKAVVQSPPGAVGAVDLEVSEGGRKARCTYRSLSVRLSAPKKSLLKGEQTAMTIVVSGLSGIQQPVSLKLTNRTPHAVKLGGGDRQDVSITPKDVAPDGTFVDTRTLTGVKSGGFSVNAVVRDQASARTSCDFPEPPVVQPGYVPPPSAASSPDAARLDRSQMSPRLGQATAPPPLTEEERARSRAEEVAYLCPRAAISTISGAQRVNGISFAAFMVRVGPRTCSVDFNPPVVVVGVQHTVFSASASRAAYVAPRVVSCTIPEVVLASPGAIPPPAFAARIAVPSSLGGSEAEVGMHGTVTLDGRNLPLQVRWTRLYAGDTGRPLDDSTANCGLYER